MEVGTPLAIIWTNTIHVDAELVSESFNISRRISSLYLFIFSFLVFFFFFSDVANRETYKKIWDIGDSLNKDELIVVENKDDDRRFYYEFVKDGPFFPYFFFFLWSEIYELSDLYLF